MPCLSAPAALTAALPELSEHAVRTGGMEGLSPTCPPAGSLLVGGGILATQGKATCVRLCLSV